MITGTPLDVLAAWPVGGVTAVTTPELGAMNERFFVQTEAGRYVMRGYRLRTRQWVEAEHAVLDTDLELARIPGLVCTVIAILSSRYLPSSVGNSMHPAYCGAEHVE